MNQIGALVTASNITIEEKKDFQTEYIRYYPDPIEDQALFEFVTYNDYNTIILCPIILEFCYYTCLYCTGKGSSTDHLCKTCNKGYISDSPTVPTNCVLCDDRWYYNYASQNTSCCGGTCPSTHPYMIPSSKQCVTDCKYYDQWPYLMTCYTKDELMNELGMTYPNGINGTIQWDMPGTLQDKKNLINNEHINEFINYLNKTIKGNDFDITVTETNSNHQSDIQLNECEKILKDHYNIPINESLIIIKIDELSPDKSSISNIDYFVYNSNTQNQCINSLDKLTNTISNTNEDIAMIDNYAPFTISLREDKRNSIAIYWSLFKNSYTFIQPFTQQSPFDIISIKFALLIINMTLGLTINAMFFEDDIVSEKYHTQGQIFLLSSLLKSLYSYLLNGVIVALIAFLTEYQMLFELIAQEYQLQKEYISLLTKKIKITERKLIIFFCVGLLIMLYSLYYCSIFCIEFIHG